MRRQSRPHNQNTEVGKEEENKQKDGKRRQLKFVGYCFVTGSYSVSLNF